MKKNELELILQRLSWYRDKLDEVIDEIEENKNDSRETIESILITAQSDIGDNCMSIENIVTTALYS